MRISYTYDCPVCHQTVTKRCKASQRPPVYCSAACHQARALADIPRDRATVWRKYTFTPAMDEAIQRATRQRLGALKALWREDTRFEAAGIPYPILKRQAVLLGCVRTESGTTWHPDERAYALQRLATGSPPDSISRAMRRHGWHRSPGAIVGMARLAGEDRHGKFFSLHAIAQGLGLDSHVPLRWVRQGVLQVHHTSDQGWTHFVSLAALRRFLTDHPFQASKGMPDCVWIIGILTTPAAEHPTTEPENTRDNGMWMTGQPIADRAAAD